MRRSLSSWIGDRVLSEPGSSQAVIEVRAEDKLNQNRTPAGLPMITSPVD